MLYKTLFEQGVDFSTYIKQGNAKECLAVSNVANQLTNDTLPQSMQSRLANISTNIHLLIVGEMWCPDCQLNITAIEHMVLLQPKIKISIISKATAELHLMELMALSQVKIPLVAILNEHYQLVNSFVERPQTVTSSADFEGIKEDYFDGKYLLDTMNEILDKLSC
jgi:thioredoxin family protein